MYFFEPYSPGELTFYGLIYGIHKLRERREQRWQQKRDADSRNWLLEQKMRPELSAEEWIKTLHSMTEDDVVEISLGLFRSPDISLQEAQKRNYFLKRRFGFLRVWVWDGRKTTGVYEEMQEFFREHWALSPIVYDPLYEEKEKAADEWVRGHRLKKIEQCEALRLELLNELRSTSSEEETALIEDRLWALMLGRYMECG